MPFLDRLIDRFSESPSFETLVRDMTRRLEEKGCTDIEVFKDRMELRSKRNGQPQTLNLGNLFREYMTAPRKERLPRLHRFLDSVLVEVKIPTDYVDAKSKLMPVVRSQAGMGIARQTICGGPDAKPDTAPVQRPLVADLVIGLVVDLPNSMSYVSERTLSDWKVTWEQALGDAIENLRALPEHEGWVEASPGVWSGEWGDSYESSRILVPDLIYRLGINDPVAMVPFRDTLLVTSAANQQGIDRMIQITHGVLDRHGRWLSFELLRLQGQTWASASVAGTTSAQQAEMRLRNRAEDYEGQRQVLQGQFDEQSSDLFIAEYALAQKGDGPLINYAVWSEGVDTLLPEADSVVMLYQEGGKNFHARLPWSVVREHFESLMESTDYMPTRYRVRRFPDRKVLQSIAATSNLD